MQLQWELMDTVGPSILSFIARLFSLLRLKCTNNGSQSVSFIERLFSIVHFNQSVRYQRFSCNHRRSHLHMTTACLEAEAMRALVSLSMSEMIAVGRGSPCAGQLVNCIILTTRVSVKCSAMTASFLRMMSPHSVTFSSLTLSLPYTVSCPSLPGQ